jgi:hypothetical protein
MNIHLLDSNRRRINTVDVYDSLIWTDRFWEAGDFQLALPPSQALINLLSDVKYLRLDAATGNTMQLENIRIKTDIEDGSMMELSGPSAHMLLDRRIVLDAANYTSSNLSEVISSTYNNECHTLAVSDRQFGWGSPYFPSSWESFTIDSINLYGESLYDLVVSLCKFFKVGWRVQLDGTTNGFYMLGLESGQNRSFSQSINPYVVFSEQNDNLLSSEYIYSESLYKTFALVLGEKGVGNIAKSVQVTQPGGAGTGLERREMLYQSSASRRTTGDGITETQYEDFLTQDGESQLAKQIITDAFDGEIQSSLYEYGVDYTLGDTVQIIDKFGHETESMVVAVTWVSDKDGDKINPTFATVS